MAGRCLLDTSIAIALFRGESEVRRQIERAGEVYLSCIVIAGLLYGALHSERVAANLARVTDLASEAPILNCDAGTADIYAGMKLRLRELGRLIPDNDLWIAATARQHELTLVSRDSHFSEIPDLYQESW